MSDSHNNNWAWVAIAFLASMALFAAAGSIRRNSEVELLQNQVTALESQVRWMNDTQDSMVELDEIQSAYINDVADVVLELQGSQNVHRDEQFVQLRNDFVRLQIDFMNCYVNRWDC